MSVARSAIQQVYDATLRPHLPRRLAVCNGVVTRRQRLFDARDVLSEYERVLCAAIREHVHEGDRVAVIGGGFGVSSIAAARQSEAAVHCYEGSARQVELINEARQYNEFPGRVEVHHAVVGPNVNVYGAVDGADRLAPSDVTPADVLVSDCEGAERPVVEQYCSEHKPRVAITEAHPDQDSPAAFVYSDLELLGYDVTEPRGDPPVVVGTGGSQP